MLRRRLRSPVPSRNIIYANIKNSPCLPKYLETQGYKQSTIESLDSAEEHAKKLSNSGKIAIIVKIPEGYGAGLEDSARVFYK